MNDLSLLFLEAAISVLASITIMLLIAHPLKSALLDLCPTEKQANFWLAYTRTMLLVSPRKGGSSWSASNKKRVAGLVRQGLMTRAGQELIDAAKKDGSWHFLDDIEKLIEPADLTKALDTNKRARKYFDAFNASARKVILLWIKTAKRDDTRAKRISETVRLAAKNVKAAHPEAKGR